MSVTEVIIRLAIVALLASYLLFSYWRRARRRVGLTNPAEWLGKGIDVTAFKPTIDEVRRTYSRPRPTGVCLHRSLLTLARRAVVHLGYFQDRDPAANQKEHA